MEWTHSRTFLKMLRLATSSLLLKILTFRIVYIVVLHKLNSFDLSKYFKFAFNTYINCF